MLFWRNIQNDNIKITQLKENMAYSQQLAKMGSWTYNILKGEVFLTEEVYNIFECDFENDDFSKNIYKDDFKIVEQANDGVLKGIDYDIDYRIITSDGKIKFIHEKTITLYEKNSKPIKVVGIIQDITDRTKTDDFNREKILRQYDVMIRESCDVFQIIDKDGTLSYVSESLTRITGYKVDEFVGKKVYDFYNEEYAKKLSGMVEFVLGDPQLKAQGDFLFIHKEGNEIYVEVTIQNLLSNPSINGILIIFKDVTSRVLMEQKITHISTHDELTNLPNRFHLKETLENECKKAKFEKKGFAAIMLEVDRFNKVVDTIGYYVGDRLLVEAANRLKKLFGKTHYLCRYSEDRFVLVLRNIDTINGYELMAKKIIDLFANSFTVDKFDIDVTVNLGICFYDDKSNEAELIVQHTEVALFWAKNEGKNKYKFYSSDIDVQTYKQFELHSDMIKAIDNDQFRVYYQPIVELKTNRIIAAEALIRWEHPSWGMVSPMEFIPIAEETGYIMSIGKWVFKKVCENYKQWKKEGYPDIKVAVNISSLQFFETNFVENVKSIIEGYGLDPSFLIMEITESILLVNTEKVLNDFKKIRSYGIHIALDDFGTGYSSLAYLSSLNIDILKMDSSFIKNISLDSTSTTITKYIINMAQELKLRVVAEGIETPVQLAYLKDLSCASGQGYIYSKPLPESSFREILMKSELEPNTKGEIYIEYKNRREHFRVDFPNLLVSDMTILEIKGKKLNVGNTKVLVKNISAGGLCFVSNLKMPVDNTIIIQFSSILGGKHLKVRGYVVWSKEHDSNLFEYGVEFVIEDKEKERLMKDLSLIQIKIKKEKVFTDGSFALKSADNYFR